MSLFITGDVHGSHDLYKLILFDRLMKNKLSKDDFVIVCGDFGMIWFEEETEEEKRNLDIVENFSFTTLFVDGNHENFTRLENLPVVDFKGGRVHKIRDSIYHLKRGEIYQIEDKTIFCFGGAFSHDRFMRKENVSWWSHELPSNEECEYALKNLDSYNNKVDIVITHDAPRRMARQFGFTREAMDNGYPANRVNICQFLDSLYDSIEFHDWYCGHYHMDADRDNYHFLYYRILDTNNKDSLEKRSLYLEKEYVYFRNKHDICKGRIELVDPMGYFSEEIGKPAYNILTFSKRGKKLYRNVEESRILGKIEDISWIHTDVEWTSIFLEK